MSERARTPRLLVSVRSVKEARRAMAGGADIIDLKEPENGSLGRPARHVITANASSPEFTNVDGPENGSDLSSGHLLSVALGEVHEFRSGDAFALPRRITYAKLGLARLREEADWVARWLAVRRAYQQSAGSTVRWIAVIYADCDLAESPPPLEILEAASFTGCAGVLVDTNCKRGGRLLDYVTPGRLACWADFARRRRLMFAVAGRLREQDLPALATVGPDVVAVRSAVCERQDRRAGITTGRVAHFKRAVRRMGIAGRRPMTIR